MNRTLFAGVSPLVAGALLLGTPGLALAQTSPSATVDEIVVTAQMREQSLQDVPVVVTSVNAQQLQDAGVRDIKDLTIVAPGLMVTSTSSSAVTTARIRGIGTVGDNPGLESSVGVVIDGVYRPRNGVAFSDLGETQRIEVLKGPQGTLFGKNTTAGVINVFTKRPSFQVGATSEAQFTNYDGFGASISLTGPVVKDVVAARIFAAARERDGYYKSAGPDNNDQKFYTGRAQVLFTPTETLDVNVSVDYTKRDERCCGAVQIQNGPTQAIILALAPGGLSSPPDPDSFRDYSNRSFLKTVIDSGTAVEANWKTPWLGGAKLTSITAFRNWKQTGGSDVDWTAADILYAPTLKQSSNPGSSKFQTFTQELRLAGSTDKLNWLIGAFYTREDLGLHVRTVTYGTQYEQYVNALFSNTLSTVFTGRPLGTTFVTGQGQDDLYNQREEGFSLFTNNSYQITEALELTVGLRYTWEDKDLKTSWSNTDGGSGCTTALARASALRGLVPTSLIRADGTLASGPYQVLCAASNSPAFGRIGTNNQSLSEEKLTGTAKLAYRISPEVMTYASYARGYKAGGFNLDRIATTNQTVAGQPTTPVLDTSFAPETVDSFEVGTKTTLFDRSVLLNATVFYQKYEDFQLNAFNGLVFSVASVPKVISKGVDLDFIWKSPIEGLSFNGGVTYAETYYPKSTPLFLGANLPGSRLSLAPLWSGSLGITYEHNLTDDLVGRIAVNSKSVSGFNTGSDLDPVKNQPAFTLVNARVGLSSADKRWAVEAFAQNLFNDVYYQVGFNAVLQSGSYNTFLGQPRTYGVALRYTY
ncbi:MAG: TonB-dependent receptor [Alphaproteobacteria bacterium]|nr:TonB-dependent receptor [Alphaproteobacteria bacterium]MBU1514040.1 TonB-dependent receptor [Alphaproteobacteria bacterium]MBU2093020.1 TonB-dependent receptor [Alphaproteobacteria bacterium]MBU2151777.1 TonB-dependent receptor [Alphaproteobacteria bacterium]MBU2309403.1 TonB-dependent receptor [Alphaproteobacteria bacterium]